MKYENCERGGCKSKAQIQLCIKHLELAEKEARDEERKKIFDILKDQELCTECGAIIKDAHYCRTCKERVAVPVDTDKLIKCIKTELEAIK